MKIFVINPGSTSTKIALYNDSQCLWTETQRYSAEALSGFPTVMEQEQFRFEEISKLLSEKGVQPSDFSAVVGRGGLLRPIQGGTYLVTGKMLDDLKDRTYGVHASSLGALLAVRFTILAGDIPAFIVDPVVVDELADEARISGLPELPRVSIFHALNQKAVARRAAAELRKAYDQCRFVVAHLGGGVSVGAHEGGRAADISDRFLHLM